MENRIGSSDGAELPKKSRSLDLKSLYKSGTSMESQHRKDVKRKISIEDGDDEKSKKRKKSTKTLSLSRLKNVDNSNRSVDGVYNGVWSSGLHDLKTSKSGLSHSCCSGFNGISFSLDDSATRIPKRKRGFVWRKKVEISQVLKTPEQSCSKVSVVDQAAKVNSDDLGTGGNSLKDSDPRFESLKDLREQFGPLKVKLKKDYDDFKENSIGQMNSVRHLKEEGQRADHLVVNHSESSLKKERRKSKSNSNRHLKEEGGHSSNSVMNNGESSLKKPNGVSNSILGPCLKEDDGGASHSAINYTNSSLKKTGRNNSKRKDSALDKRIVAKEAKTLIDASSKVRKREDSDQDRNIAMESEHLNDDSGKLSKRKDSAQDKRSVAKEADPLIDTAGKVCENSLEVEEKLEENAAMMLSSQFDPSCTGNGLSFLLSSGQDSGGHESSLLDAAGRALRPRTRLKEKGHSRKRRHYYEIFSGDLDGYWVLYRRIKVFWPLDQSWYYGLVDDYDEGKKLHHVKYDDREEEWINLENEMFKLLLLPSEVPGLAASRRSRKREKSFDEEKGILMSSKEKDKRNLTTGENYFIGSYMDSEPIISWLARSNRWVKSSPSPTRRKQEIRDLLLNEVGNVHGCVDADSKTRKLSDKSELLDRLAYGERGEESALESPTCSKDSRLPIVYYRRRFCKTGSLLCSTSSGNHLSSSTPASVALLASSIDEFWDFEEHDDDTFCKRQVPNGALWSTATGNAGFGLTIPLIESRKARFEFSFPVFMILNHAFGENLWLAHAVFLLHHGKLMTMWPSVYLEMLFVDNVVGLRYFMFEGCLKEALAYVFLVLKLFHQPREQDKCADLQLPVTSIRFKFSCFQNLRKQFVFAFYNFAEMKNSTWMYMESELKRQCMLTRQLSLSECTYDNIKAVQNGGNWLSTASVCWHNSSIKGLRRMSKQGSSHMGVSRESTHGKVSQFSSNSDTKRRNLPPFALSFTAAPSFFISLHLKLLMEHNGAGMGFRGHGSIERPESDDSLMAEDSGSLDYCLNKDSESTYETNASECMLETDMSKGMLDNNVKVMSKEAESDGCLPVVRSELEVVSSSVCGDGNWTRFPRTCRIGDLNVAGTSANFQELEKIGSEAIISLQKLQCHDPESEQCVLSPRPSGDCDKTNAATYHSPLNGIRVEIPTFDLFEKNDRAYHSAKHSTDLNWNINGDIIPSPDPTAPRSTWHRNRSSSSFGYLAHGWSDGKADIVHYNFGNTPKKPRTQVSYSLPCQGFDYSPKNRVNPQKGVPHTRIRREKGKSLSDVSRGSKKNLALLSCDANLLITHGDKCRRECGAQIVLELFEHNEWKLAVKLSGTTRYSYKAHQFLQPGSTNRYTNAMMWKGGKDWILEFPDRSRWVLFKEMHEECCNRNVRAASVKNIPIPGVRLVEEFDENGTEVAFVRSSSKYFRQVETDVEMALYPSRVLYGMDSDDEQFLKIHSSSEADDSGLWEISEELFEKIMDMFEKAAYSQQRDQFTTDEIDELMAGVGSTEAIKVIYEHWRQKRQKRGMPLIRHLQPPLWKRFQQQVKEWEIAVSKTNSSLPNGCQCKVSPIGKPPMFAFCLKPRGLEVPDKGSTHRSHRKISVSSQSNTITGDHDFHSFGRRINGFAFGDEKVLYPGHNYKHLDDSPLSHTSPRLFSPRVFSPRDAGSIGYFSLSNDGFDRNPYQKLQRNRSKKFGMYESSIDTQMVTSCKQRLMGRRNGAHRWNTGYSERPSQLRYADGFQRHGPEMLDGPHLDVYKLRDSSGAAQQACNMAKLKRERAEILLYRADLAIHKAVNALMIAEAVKTYFDDVNSDR